ncbi:DUF1345 domain-containing protein [Sphingomonas sp. RP10(2022)]|uniref:DUF1345 domain-containing protein n=1 Tax=Sphingomonas liriopis TaxID=2949094 RepID=A0A9X2HTQ1_9SPHN|nr:DUF1345 domain-containing protein [Sphingomonas liriopis]MCP3734196.1 DUF1345 domain-containing protein [Sphingomonas liriopis]
MGGSQRYWGIGSRIAPPRFALFVLLFVVGLAVLIPMIGKGRGIMAAFDLAAAVFLAVVAPLFRHGEATRMRQAARDNDANRALLLGLTAATMIVILVAVAGELKGKNDTLAIALVIATLVLAWLFTNMVYALHYAHLFYSADTDGGDAGGLEFPECDQPDYWDFLYFSATLGMTFQTSDVSITARSIRRVVLGHCLAAFVFNLGVLAFTINVLGGG